MKFDTSEECEMHMRREHSDDISIDQLAMLVEKSAHPAADPLDVLVRCEETGSGDRSVCPLCPFATDNTRVPEPLSLVPEASASADTGKVMRDHIAEHLESIALLSLPEQEVDDAASDEVQSESARKSSHGEQQDLEPLPLLTSDEWDTYNRAMAQSELENFDKVLDAIPPSKDIDWTFVTATEVELMCNKLNLPRHVTAPAECMVAIAQADKGFRGVSNTSIMVVCIYIACCKCGVVRSFPEIVETLETSILEATAILDKLEHYFDDQDVFKVAASTFDPGRDPVLLPFVERARRIQMAEIRKRLGVPLIVISDPEGLEISEAQWADKPGPVQVQIASATQSQDTSSTVKKTVNKTNKSRRKIHQADSESYNAPDSSPPASEGPPQDIHAKWESFFVPDGSPSASEGPPQDIPEIVVSVPDR
ncbi:MAG: hypothetical protein Q9168_006777 [Polycauliona sp. 1 TL-2023]